MDAHTRFTRTIWIALPLIDAGHSESVDTIWERIQDGTLFDYLRTKYQDADVSFLSEADRQEVLEYFRAIYPIDAHRRFGIAHNGLVLIVGLALGGVQESASTD